MATLTKGEFQELADQYDGLRASYSGRGMYGGEGCLAYTGDEQSLFMFDLAELLARRDDDDPIASDIRYQLVNLGSGCTDSMGRGIVLYFPRVTVEGSDDLEDDDEEDEDDD